MLFTETIRRKRDGHPLTDADIDAFVTGLADGSLPAEQVAALAMAICLNGMTAREAARLTRGMARSGRMLDWSDAGLRGPVVDKHSTGGIGDKVSLVLAPMAAACGCHVPMISGRGLGHTGGTLDKLDSIPGYDATPDAARFRSVVRDVGCAIIGQTADLAPADRRLYAIRDITATVESIPLITASILSKKLAAGNAALVLDVKTGSGAFMPTMDGARELALSIVATAADAGLVTHALVTDMDAPLGRTAGNALEVMEALAYLRNDASDERLDTVSVALVAEMLAAAGIEPDRARAAERARTARDSGSAAETFGRMVAALGGPADIVERPQRHLASAPCTLAVVPETPGFLAAVDTRAVGQIIIELGGGRRRASDVLDLTVGFSEFAGIGAPVDEERPLAIVHARTRDEARKAAEALRSACRVAPESRAPGPPILKTLTRDDVNDDEENARG